MRLIKWLCLVISVQAIPRRVRGEVSGGTCAIPAVMTPEECEKAVIEHHAKLVKVSMLG